MKKFSKHVLAAFFLILTGMGCQQKPEELPEGANSYTVDEPEASTSTVPYGARLAKERLIFDALSTDNEGKLPIVFRLLDEQGKEMVSSDLKVAHERKMHILFVRNDLRSFQHLHPVYEKGRWRATASVSQPGPYTIFIDVEPVREPPLVLRAQIQLGEGIVTRLPDPDLHFSVESLPYRAELIMSEFPRAGETNTLSYRLTKDGKPLKDLKPYLGAFGHAIILGHDSPDAFLHTHPLTTKKPSDGVVGFDVVFPRQGRYTIFAEFDVGVGVRVFPMTIDVSRSASSEPTTTTTRTDPIMH